MRIEGTYLLLENPLADLFETSDGHFLVHIKHQSGVTATTSYPAFQQHVAVGHWLTAVMPQSGAQSRAG